MKKIITTILVGSLFATNFSFALTRCNVGDRFGILQGDGSCALENSVGDGAVPANYCPNISSNLSRGKNNSEVKELQKFLKDYYDLSDDNFSISGTFGRLTQKYVTQFQKDNGLIQTGNVGALTRAKIASACSGGNQNANQTNAAADIKSYPSGDYGTQYEDFNFDGLQDKIVYSQSNNAYGDVKIYVQTTSGNYILSDELTNLINQVRERGYFQVDRTNKRIITGGASSCCIHSAHVYDVVPNVGLRQIFSITEDSQSSDVPSGKIKVSIGSIEQARANGASGFIPAFGEDNIQFYDVNSYKPWTYDDYLKSHGTNQTSQVQVVNVLGMKKFNDSDLAGSNFGFSFWYPETWGVGFVGAVDPSPYQGGKVVGKYEVLENYGRGPKGITVEEFLSDNLSITDATGVGPCPVCSKTTYSFDTNSHAWTINFPDGSNLGPSSGPTIIPNVDANNSMGGLHVFGGSKRFGGNVIIPLSAKKFLVITSLDSNTEIDEGNLAKTVLATDPSVATPVSVNDQQKVVEAERKAYLGY